MSEGESPIFILASGQRCGSTLLQRLLNSHHRILVWGEHNGILNRLRGEHQRLLAWSSRFDDPDRRFTREGLDSWTANMTPPPEVVVAAGRAYLETLFALPARRLGRTRWGFKEVRYGAEVAAYLLSLFPEARVVHLTRDVVDCFISLKRWENEPYMAWDRGRTLEALGYWQSVNAGFLALDYSPRWYLRLRYEDLLSEQDRIVATLCDFLSLDQAELDLGVFANRIHNGALLSSRPRAHIPRSALDPEERALLSRPDIVELCTALGYAIRFSD